MKPQCEGAIKVLPNSVGLNISGLAYSNKFRALSNRFDAYPLLIRRLIESFQKLNISVYLVSHSYNYERPEEFNDDLIACKQVFESLPSQEFVYLIDDNLNSPQTKQLISQFDFFIGTRMHACFAAIYTKTPVFGLAYSYKFKGAFDENGLQGNYVDIVNISVEDVKSHVEKIINVYIEQNKRGAI
jgi:polysaccharide pyruvyl transferase WcaK-like protein